MSQQPPGNVQLTCPNCMNAYLIQAQFQTAPHQCPHCGAMQGQPQTQHQNPALQNPQLSGMNPAGGYPGANTATHPTRSSSAANGVSIVFIVRCIVGSMALIAIVITAIYILGRGFGPVIDVGVTGGSEQMLAGEYASKKGGSFEITFLATTPSGADAKFKIISTGHEDATINDAGKFNWRVPKDAKARLYDFDVLCWDPEDEDKRTYITFQVDVAE